MLAGPPGACRRV